MPIKTIVAAVVYHQLLRSNSYTLSAIANAATSSLRRASHHRVLVSTCTYAATRQRPSSSSSSSSSPSVFLLRRFSTTTMTATTTTSSSTTPSSGSSASSHHAAKLALANGNSNGHAGASDDVNAYGGISASIGGEKNVEWLKRIARDFRSEFPRFPFARLSRVPCLDLLLVPVFLWNPVLRPA